MAFVMKSSNFITIFQSPKSQTFKVVYVTFRTKIDSHLPSHLSLSLPLAQFPAISKSQRKELTACTFQAATVSSILQHGKGCVGSDTTEIAVAISLSIQRFHFKLFPPNG